MKKQKESVLINTKIAVVFFVFLAFFIGVSLIFKVVLIVRAGQFDESKRFNITISNNKDTDVMSFSPAKKIAVFKLNKSIKNEDAGGFLGIPIDGFIISNSLDLSQNPNALFLKTIYNYKSLRTNLTIIDILKLAFFTGKIPERSVNTQDISNLEKGNVDKIVSRLSADELIQKDNQTIQIINGTSTEGLGARLARLITNMGGNVIIVATSDRAQKKSAISYIDQKTYTVERLSKVLGYEAVKAGGNAISDVTIMIGEDKSNSPLF